MEVICKRKVEGGKRTVTSVDDVVTVFSWDVIQALRQPPAITVKVQRPQTALEPESARPQLLGKVSWGRRRGNGGRLQVPEAEDGRRGLLGTTAELAAAAVGGRQAADEDGAVGGEVVVN